MLVKDLKSIIDLMELATSPYACVKVYGKKAYATNGKALTTRDVAFTNEGFIDKHFLPKLKGIYTLYKKQEFIDESIESLFISDYEGFPSTDLGPMFDQEFKYEIRLDADVFLKAMKSLKGKDNKIIFKIKDEKSPFLFVHDNGKGLIAPAI